MPPLPFTGVDPKGLISTVFERPAELIGQEPGTVDEGPFEDTVDVPLGAPRDPLNLDGGPPGPAGGSDPAEAGTVTNAIKLLLPAVLFVLLITLLSPLLELLAALVGD